MCKTYRDYFIEAMEKKGESFKDVVGYVGNGYGMLDENALEESDAYAKEEDISLHVYTTNWIYTLRYIREDTMELHWHIQVLPLPNNPEFKHVVFP